MVYSIEAARTPRVSSSDVSRRTSQRLYAPGKMRRSCTQQRAAAKVQYRAASSNKHAAQKYATDCHAGPPLPPRRGLEDLSLSKSCGILIVVAVLTLPDKKNTHVFQVSILKSKSALTQHPVAGIQLEVLNFVQQFLHIDLVKLIFLGVNVNLIHSLQFLH